MWNPLLVIRVWTTEIAKLTELYIGKVGIGKYPVRLEFTFFGLNKKIKRSARYGQNSVQKILIIIVCSKFAE